MLKFVSFQNLAKVASKSKISGVGVGLQLGGNKVLDLQSAAAHVPLPASISVGNEYGIPILSSMTSFIESGDDAVAWARHILQEANTSSVLSSTTLNENQYKLLAPIPVPRRNVMCVGKNYKDHVAEVAKADKAHGIGTTSAPTPELPKYPQFFTKVPNAVVGPHDEVQSHVDITPWLDYEAELAVIIGKEALNLTRENALDYVFGYSVANDITARDVQRHHGQWFKGKSLDTTCPMGPCILHASSPNFDPQNLAVKLWINGDKRQDSNTSNMIFDIPEILKQLSRGMKLYPGDVILTGTPDGVGYARKPPLCLKRGDHMLIEIENIGKLENTVV